MGRSKSSRRRASRAKPARHKDDASNSRTVDASQRLRQTVIALWLITLLAHALGYGPLTGTLWGAHFYAFFSLPVFAAGLVFLLFAALPLLPGNPVARHWHAWISRRALDLRQMTIRSRLFLGAIIGLAGFAILWVFRVRHLLLGDSNVLVDNLPKGNEFHSREPLTMWLHQQTYDWIRTLQLFGETPPTEVARFSTALESVLCGVAFIFVVWKLTRELVPQPTGASISCTVLILTQGFVLLFFGYPENYTYQTLALCLYLLFSVRFLKGSCGVVEPTLALVLALGLHLSSLALLPSFAALLVVGWLDVNRRQATIRRFAVTSMLVGGLILLLQLRVDDFSVERLVGGILREAITGKGTGSGWSYALSDRHLRDFLDEQFLIGPFGLLFFLPALVFAIRREWAARSVVNLFLAVAGLSYLGGNWFAADPVLGYPRDWDVFAPSALVFVTAALGLFLYRGEPDDDDRAISEPAADSADAYDDEVRVHGALLGAALISLFHVVPWIVLNTSELRALERTKSLLMDFGRDEMVVGRYYLARGDAENAEDWLLRSAKEWKYNVNTHHLLGSLYMGQHKYEEAARSYTTAVSIRPDKLLLRSRLVSALVAADRSLDAEPHLRLVAEGSPSNLPFWRRYGLVLLEKGKIERARAALDHARTLYPTPAEAARDLAAQCRLLAGKLTDENNLGLARVCEEFAQSFSE